MTERSATRNWSTKTLAKQLIRFIRSEDSGILSDSTVTDLLEALKSQIVADEVGEDLEL